MNTDRPLIYLGSPFTHNDKLVEHARYLLVLAAWKWCVQNWPSQHIIAAIVLSYPAVKSGDMPGDWHFWQEFDQTLISKCSEFWIFCIDGYKQSVGLTAEIQIAKSLGLKIRYLSDSGNGYTLTDSEPYAS